MLTVLEWNSSNFGLRDRYSFGRNGNIVGLRCVDLVEEFLVEVGFEY